MLSCRSTDCRELRCRKSCQPFALSATQVVDTEYAQPLRSRIHGSAVLVIHASKHRGLTTQYARKKTDFIACLRELVTPTTVSPVLSPAHPADYQVGARVMYGMPWRMGIVIVFWLRRIGSSLDFGTRRGADHFTNKLR